MKFLTYELMCLETLNNTKMIFQGHQVTLNMRSKESADLLKSVWLARFPTAEYGC
jgi:hypothetical protein